LGDSIRFLAAGEGLMKKYPTARVHYFGAGFLEELFKGRANHAYHVFFPCDNMVRPRDEIIDETKHKHLDVGINYDITVDGWCPPYLHEPATKGVCCQDRTELWCREAGVPFIRPKLVPTEEDLKKMELAKDTLKRYKAIVGIQVGATCKSREYPYYYVDELIRLLKLENIAVILFDVCYRWHKDIKVRSNILLSIDADWSTTIGRLLACDIMVTPDSGFYHLSGLLSKKCIGIFGATSGQITSRPYNIGKKTGLYMQLKHDEIDYTKIPDTCKPTCYMRWERGWNFSRYRDHHRYCAVIEQIKPVSVFNNIIKHMEV